MRTLRALIGLPVIVHNRRIGRVVQTELSDDLKQFAGIWINAGFFGARFISADSIGTIGQIAIMADDSGKRKRCKSHSLFRRAIGTDGSRIGAITGAIIDELSFRIEALELSCGIWDDLLNGRKHIHEFTVNQKTGDVIINVAEIEKEVKYDEERYDEGTDRRRSDRRFRSDDVRRHELAVRTPDEPADEKNRTLARQQDG